MHDRVNELIALTQTPHFIASLREAHAEQESNKKAKDSDNEEDEKEAEEILENLEKANQFETERSIFPSLSTFLERMDENLWKSYQKLAARSSSVDYLERINDENKLLFLIDKTLDLLNQFDLEVFKARISLIKLTYIYYKNDSTYAKIRKRIEQKGDAAADMLNNVYFMEDSAAVIEQIVQLVKRIG